MSERAYNRLANLLMLISVGSALLFDSGKFPHAVVGTSGILSGVAALTLYFWNQYQISEKKKEPDAPQGEVTAAEMDGVETMPVQDVARAVHFFVDDLLIADKSLAVSAGDMWRIAVQTNFRDNEFGACRRRAAQAWLSHYSENYARHLRWSVAKGDARALMQPEVELSPKEVAACAIEIMRNLAILDDLHGEWEYSFGPKGLRVSLKRAHSVRPVVPQEDFDFDISSVVQ